MKRYDRLKGDLFAAADRVARKQTEVLKAAGASMKLSVPLDNATVYKDKKPREKIDSPESNEKIGVSETKVLKIRLDDNKYSARTFNITVNRAFPDWQQIYVKVKISDKDGKPIEEKEIAEVGNTNKEFWVGPFDFPGIDNTFLSNKERFSIVLEKFDYEKKTETGTATLVIVYFPAKYSGLKEKSFYHQKTLNYLESVTFLNEKKQESILDPFNRTEKE